jgi:ABC-type proline/glycine betaine transport system substrate-binding protein
MPLALGLALLVGGLALAGTASAAAQSEPLTAAQRAEEARTLMVVRPANITSALLSIGLEASLLEDAGTHAVLRAGNYNIYLERCTTAHCKIIRMEVGMPRSPTTVEKINQINRSFSGVRVSIRPEAPDMILVDVTYHSTAGVVSFENLRSLSEYLQMAIPELDKLLANN